MPEEVNAELVPRTKHRLSPGRHYPLGATVDAEGVQFALYSQWATEVWLLLFDRPDGPPTDLIPLRDRDRHVWHVHVAGLGAGQLYGYKVRGPFDPKHGQRFNEHKLLIDPYARALSGKLVNEQQLLLAYDAHDPARDLSLDVRDNSAVVPKAIVIDDHFDWQGDAPPRVPVERLVIYETHLKGMTAHPSSGVAPERRGTYLGFIEKIPYLKALGINAVELLPVHEHYVEDFLRARGLSNYWGYNTVSFFAPESSYSTGRSPGCQVAEFKTLVRELHRAGIEIILDVVYNHSAEGNELGPTFSLRGIDNTAYYALSGDADAPARYYMNWSGCGNSLNLGSAPALRLVLDSLRYWAEVMHVDGFRFDLASVLGREGGMYQRCGTFFDAVSQDPVLQRCRLIAEPWDLGAYEVGNFPVDWFEWNGRFRDTVRRFVKGDAGQIRDLGFRVTGSSDLYSDDGRSAYHSVNFVTCHDGFTLHDLVSYDRKHNDSNGEGNRDGADDNHSWNCGVEGDTADPAVLRLRRQLARTHVALLLLSSGTPMILGGDEFLRTQRGNNNGHCHDNELTWFDWDLAERHQDFIEFVRRLIAYAARHPILRRRVFFTGTDRSGNRVPDIQWFGDNLEPPRWQDPEERLLCYLLDGAEEPSDAGDYLLFVIHNADHRHRSVRLPDPGAGRSWRRVLDTSLPAAEELLGGAGPVIGGDGYVAAPRSTVLLESSAPSPGAALR